MSKFMYLFTASLLLTACGGGGDSKDSEEPEETFGEVGGERAELSEAAVELSKQIVSYESSGGSPFAIGAKPSEVEGLGKIDGELFKIETSDTSSIAGSCGGSYTVTTTTSRPDDDTIFPIEADAEGRFEDYCVGDKSQSYIEFDGDFDWYWLISSERSVYTYNYDYSYTTYFSGITRTGTTSASESCVVENTVSTCTIGSSYETSGGDEYEITDVNLSGDEQNGYDLTATVVDEDDNSYSITGENLTRCDDGNIGSGTIELEINNDLVIDVDFLSCTEYQVTYLGTTERFTQ